MRFLLFCWPVPDPHARYKWAIEIGEERFTGPTEDYFGDHANLHEGNLQEALDRGEAAELPPMIIIRGANDSNIPPFIPHKFEASCWEARGHVELELFEGMPHLFGNTPGPESDRAIELMKGFVAKQLAPSAVAPV